MKLQECENFNLEVDNYLKQSNYDNDENINKFEIKNYNIVRGKIRVNQFFPIKEAYVTPDCIKLLPKNLRYDILIDNIENRNRSMHNDTVYVRLLNINQWKKKGE